MYYIGLDTSCYTTSIAVVDQNKKVVFDERIILKVSEGERGLRQSDAVFQHNSNIAELTEALFKTISLSQIKLISVSSRPRNDFGSYMPVFTVGLNTAKIMGRCLNIPIIETTHQQSHIAAGIWSSKAVLRGSFLVYHISGGTSELLLAENQMGKLTVIGGTNDLNAGQFIDRVGVSMGLKFPCGQQMDNLCDFYASDSLSIPVSISECYMSLSGPESHVQRYIKSRQIDEALKASVSKGVFLCIAKSLEKTIINAVRKYETADVLIVGGVASNKLIKEYIYSSKAFKSNNIRLFFCEPRYSTDNALGTALIGVDAEKLLEV